jgi:hypothetical protein
MNRSIRTRNRIYQFALCVLLSLTGQSANAEELLRWKLTAGESLSYQFTQSTQTETAGTGKPMRVGIDTAMTVNWKVDSVDANRVSTITQTIDKFSVTLKTDKLDPITYDSAAKSPPLGPAREIADTIGKLIGVPCQIQMTDRGEISSVESVEPLQRALGPAADKASNKLLTPAQISGMLRQAAVILPEKAIAEGNSWEMKQEISTPTGQIEQTSQFTYLGMADHGGKMQNKITVKATFALLPSADKTPPLKIIEGQQNGTLWFDSTAGRFVSSELTQKLVTERPYRDMTIRVQSSSTLTMKLAP